MDPRDGHHVLGHRNLTRSVDRDRRGEDEAGRLAEDRLVYEVDAGLEVRSVVVGADEMRKPLGRIRGEVVDDVERPVVPQGRDEARVAQIPLDPPCCRVDVLAKAPREVIGRNDLHSGGQTVVDDVRADESSRPRDEDPRAGRRRPQAGGLRIHSAPSLPVRGSARTVCRYGRFHEEGSSGTE